MLGNSYEYFYDLNGHFIFQKKKTYLDTSWTPVSFYVDGDAVVMKDNGEEFVFEFLDNELVNSISIYPGIDKVKNDFIVYGETENKHPIHLRYAIDEKPTVYKAYGKKIDGDKSEDYKFSGITYYASGEFVGDNLDRPSANSSNDWVELTNHPKQLIHPRKTATYFSMSKRNFELANNAKIAVSGESPRYYAPLEVGKFLKIDNTVHKIIAIESSLLGTRKRIYLDDPDKQLGLSIGKVYWSETINGIEEYKTTDKYVDWRELIY
jgi:hypothetical protein